jgi:uncharacterized DUF497 family protein
MMYINNLLVEWDEKKAASNAVKHRLHFAVAAFALDDPYACIIPDHKHSFHERRHHLIGDCGTGIVLIVITRRIQGTVRIISARRTNRKERRQYEAQKKSR